MSSIDVIAASTFDNLISQAEDKAARFSNLQHNRFWHFLQGHRDELRQKEIAAEANKKNPTK